MTHDAVCESILEYLCSIVLLDINRNTALMRDELLDSFDRVGLIGHLEELLEISVTAEQFGEANFENIDSIATWAMLLKRPS